MDERVKEASEQRDMLLKLIASPGWKELSTVLEATIATTMDEVIYNACEGVDKVLIQEFQKGKLAGLRHMTTLPDAIINAANGVIDSLTQRDEEEMTDAA